MKIICIMGISNSGKSTVENTLEKMGFKRSISYTTRKPEVRSGRLEKNGISYFFVSKERFKELVDKKHIIEYEEYNGNLYGTPKLHGASSFVTSTGLKGYRALKNMYKGQVLGVYLDCSEDKARERDGVTIDESRIEEDRRIIKGMAEEADIVIDSNKDLNRMLADILQALSEKGI